MLKKTGLILFSCLPLFARQITIDNSQDLINAFKTAVAGDTVFIAPGEYIGDTNLSGDPGNLPNGTGYFWVGNDGTAANPIVFIAKDPMNPPVLKGTSLSSGYVIHATGDYVYLKNLEVTFGDKGVIFDNSNHSILEGSEIHNAGSELVHVRDGSNKVTLSKNKIYNSGNGGNGSIGEGIYVGTDQARWGADDRPQSEWGDKAISEGYGGYDWRVDGTQILCNYMAGSISAETMDIKEGTTNTYVSGNVLVGDSIGKKPGAQSYDDSFIDIKGVKASFYNNSFCNCGNTLERYINEVTRASYAHIPASLTPDEHSKFWCDDSANDNNICLESQNAIISVPFDPRENCTDVFAFSYSGQNTGILEISNTAVPFKNQFNANGQSLVRNKNYEYMPTFKK